MNKGYLLMTLYRDTTRRFTREECDLDNEFNTEIPYDIVLDFFKEKIKDSFKGDDTSISDDGLLGEWLDEYTMDTTVDLFDYCMDRGYEPTEFKAPMRIYSYDIWDGDKGIILAKSYKEAVEEFKENYEAPIDDIDNMEYDSGVCRIDYVGNVSDKAKLMYMYN